MKKLRTTLLAMSLLATVSVPALAQTKIATVDMRQLFDNYWKTKQAQAFIQDKSAQLTKDDKSMKDNLQKDTDEYQQLLTQANDPTISADERARRKQAAADKLKQIEDRRAAIEQYERQAQATLSDQLQRMSAKILADIQAVVNDKAKAGGYTVVLNTAAEEINLGNGKVKVPSPVVYSEKQIDLTADVLKQLNAGAPIDLTTSAPTPAVSPVPSLTNTNSP